MTLDHARRRCSAGFVLAILAVLATMLLAQGPTPGRANGVPTFVDLRYIEGLSNWGPQDATGRLELSFAEGYAKVQADRLPQLERERYQAWLVNSQTNAAISAGRFNADASGKAVLDGTLPLITDFGFDLFILTVEPEPDDAPQPTDRRAIGGRFALASSHEGQQSTGDVTNRAAQPSTGAAGSTSQRGTTPGDVSNRPAQLPTTGEAPLVPDVVRGLMLLGAMLLTGAIGRRLGRRTS
ncbi:MAG: hypothetical protein IT299_13915 [Dehalococcoidia bacterium]|nr:hypothetical protein [Dehalococcoidia bacterium]